MIPKNDCLTTRNWETSMSLSWCHLWLHPQYYCMPLFLVFHIRAMSKCLHSPECYAFLYPCVYLLMLFPFCQSCTSKLLFFHGSSVTSGTFSMWAVLPHVLGAHCPPMYSLQWSRVFTCGQSIAQESHVICSYFQCLSHCLSGGGNQYIFAQWMK